jgi:protoheme IX farnesyltransferase
VSLKAYYHLTKPGIIYGNDLAAAAGFLLASGRHINGWLLILTLLGISLVIGSGCVFNNFLDRAIDRKMDRTKKRALVQGTISTRAAIFYGISLALAGFIVLGFFTNLVTVLIGVVGIVDYVVLYGYVKRRSSYGTLVGSISGAVPPLAGYTAVTGRIDMAGALLFLILVFWQMPHFYAIAMYRLKDYARAGLPVLPLARGLRTTKLHIIGYVLWFIVAASLLWADGYTGITYLVGMVILGFWWLWLGLRGFRSKVDDTRWARGMFLRSLIVLCVFCVLVATTAWLP